MQPAIERSQGWLGMVVVRRADDDRIQRSRIQHCAPVGVDRIDLQGITGERQALGAAPADRGNLGAPGRA